MNMEKQDLAEAPTDEKLLDISPADLAELSPEQKQRVFEAIVEIEKSLATAEQNAKGKKIVDQLTAPERALFHGCWLLRETARTVFQKLPDQVKNLFQAIQNRSNSELNRGKVAATLEGREAT